MVNKKHVIFDELLMEKMINDGGDDHDDEISGFPLGLATFDAILGNSWVLDFCHYPCLLLVASNDMQENTAVLFYNHQTIARSFSPEAIPANCIPIFLSIAIFYQSTWPKAQ